MSLFLYKSVFHKKSAVFIVNITKIILSMQLMYLKRGRKSENEKNYDEFNKIFIDYIAMLW